MNESGPEHTICLECFKVFSFKKILKNLWRCPSCGKRHWGPV